MRSSLAPVEARSAEDAAGFPAVSPRHGVHIDSNSSEKFHAGVRDDPAITGQLCVSRRHQCVSQGDTKLAGQMVVAGAGFSQRRIARPDDEPLARQRLVTLLNRVPDIDIVGECQNGLEAVASIKAQKPDLVFLDVQMPELDGFDVLEMLGKDLPPAIVFVTAYDQYALKAFEIGRASCRERVYHPV